MWVVNVNIKFKTIRGCIEDIDLVAYIYAYNASTVDDIDFSAYNNIIEADTICLKHNNIVLYIYRSG